MIPRSRPCNSSLSSPLPSCNSCQTKERGDSRQSVCHLQCPRYQWHSPGLMTEFSEKMVCGFFEGLVVPRVPVGPSSFPRGWCHGDSALLGALAESQKQVLPLGQHPPGLLGTSASRCMLGHQLQPPRLATQG